MPIYRQILDQVRAQIATGRLAAGEFLPSVRQVASELTVNPMTVSKAYSLLERDGIVELVRGQGMRVVGQPVREGKSWIATKWSVSSAGRQTRSKQGPCRPRKIAALVQAAFEERQRERARPRSH